MLEQGEIQTVMTEWFPIIEMEKKNVIAPATEKKKKKTSYSENNVGLENLPSQTRLY